MEINELEAGSEELGERVRNTYTGNISGDCERIILVLCSVAISLKRIADEAIHASSFMRVDK